MNTPIHIAHSFAPGEFSAYPVPNVAGAQTNVKARHPDGSVKHVWYYFLMGGISGQTGQITFQNASSVNNNGMTTNQMLAMCPDVQLELWNSDFSILNHQVSLRNMIFDHAIVNATGPVCTDITVQDTGIDGTFNANGVFDSAGNKTTHPIWEVKFWPTIGGVEVILVIEQSTTIAVQESWFATRIRLNGNVVYEQNWDVHPAGTKRFWRTWIGPQIGKVAINHNIAHLAQSRALPNFDARIVLDPQVITNWKAKYAAAPLSDYSAVTVNGNLQPADNAGLLTRSMSLAGTRPDLGTAPEWVIDYLYSGDPDLLAISLEEAQRACRYPMFYREQGAYPIGTGDVPRVDNRPKSDFLQVGNFADGFDVTGDKASWGWLASDRQHAPSPFYALYLVTGEHWLLDCAIQWAAFWTGVTNGATTDNRGRGPTGKEGSLGLPLNYGCRGPAHIFQFLCETAWICPDSLEIKSYFESCINATVAAFEAIHGLTGTIFEGTPVYQWAKSVEGDKTPMHSWTQEYSTGVPIDDAAFKPNTVYQVTPHWEFPFMDVALRVAADKGYPTDALINYRATWYSQWAAMGMPLALCIGTEAPSKMAAVDGGSNMFASPQATLAAYVDGYDFAGGFYGGIGDLNHGYPILCITGAAAISDPISWQFYKINGYDKIQWTFNPKWAIIPRGK